MAHRADSLFRMSNLPMARNIILTGVAVSVLSVQLIALCSMPPPPCAAMADATHVFYGEVIESSPSLCPVGPDTVSDTVSRSARREVRFDVLNALKGINTDVFTETFTYDFALN